MSWLHTYSLLNTTVALERLSLRKTDRMLMLIANIVITVKRRMIVDILIVTGMITIIFDGRYNLKLYFSMFRWWFCHYIYTRRLILSVILPVYHLLIMLLRRHTSQSICHTLPTWTIWNHFSVWWYRPRLHLSTLSCEQTTSQIILSLHHLVYLFCSVYVHPGSWWCILHGFARMNTIPSWSYFSSWADFPHSIRTLSIILCQIGHKPAIKTSFLPSFSSPKIKLKSR